MKIENFEINSVLNVAEYVFASLHRKSGSRHVSNTANFFQFFFFFFFQILLNLGFEAYHGRNGKVTSVHFLS